MPNTYVVIMAGGIGSRFWPYSRAEKPKQFLDVLGTGRSLIQMTYDRFLNITESDNIFVITNKRYKALVKEQLPDLSDDQILLEPIGRNTSAAVAYPAYKIKQKDPDGVMIVAPSDHVVFKEKVFKDNISTAVKSASGSNKLITLGIVPSRPETGYGYIQYHSSPLKKVKKVKTFTEKPELDLAKKFIESGDFVWNAGSLSGQLILSQRLSKITFRILPSSLKRVSLNIILTKNRPLLIKPTPNVKAFPLIMA